MKKDYFIFFASCIPVFGKYGITICDTQYGEIHWFPHDLEKLIESIDKRISILDMKKTIFKNDQQGLELFLTYFLDKKLGFYTKSPEKFPKLSMVWDHPSRVTNAIVDFDEYSTHKMEHFIGALDRLHCQHIQLRYFCEVNKEKIIGQLNSVKTTSVTSLDIVLTSQNLSIEDLKSIYYTNSKINSFTVFNSDADMVVQDLPFMLSYMKRKISNEKSCGLITENHFSSNIKIITETLVNNNCLNRKVSIDRTGEIKNCPSMNKSYGNVLFTNLLDVIDTVLNSSITKIKKEQIHGCRECEYRMVCTDCRAYIDFPNDIYSKPLKCGYDPSTATWSDWSNNILKKKTIKFYELS